MVSMKTLAGMRIFTGAAAGLALIAHAAFAVAQNPNKAALPVPEPPAPAPAAAPQPAPTAASAPAPVSPSKTEGEGESNEPTEEQREQARVRFERGVLLLRQEAYAPALAEFLESRKLYPTRSATNNAAIVLRKLNRYDEALDMFETLLRDFKVPDADRDLAQRYIAELRGLVGTIDISGAEPGASIVVGGEGRGEYPPVKPIRVAAGTHVVRIFKEGFEPFETRIDVAGGQTTTLSVKKMQALTSSGKLRVTERTGQSVDVVVDNVVVGKAPWEGRLSTGSHTVVLRGEGKLGTQPSLALIKGQELTALTLLAEDLDASLRVEPTPPGASVWINSVNVGNGVWLGRLKSGRHRVEVKSEGFLPVAKTVTLSKGQRENVTISLERDEDAPLWRKPSKVFFDGGISFLAAPSLSGDVSGGCVDACERDLGSGGLLTAQGGYELGSGLGFGIQLGGMVLSQDIRNRTTAFTPVGYPSPLVGTADDSLFLSGFMAGGLIAYHFGERFPLTFRTGVGAMFGQVQSIRQGSFRDSGGALFEADRAEDSPSVTAVFVTPEARIGYKVTAHWEVSLGVSGMLLIVTGQPRWNRAIELKAGRDGIGTYPNDALLGDNVLMFAPGINARYDY